MADQGDRMSILWRVTGATLGVCAAAVIGCRPAAAAVTTFETGPVRPVAMSPDGNTLFVANTPDGRLEIFTITAGGLTHTGAVPVGLEPCAVAARTNSEVWVVNHLSDSVSIVDVGSTPPHVKRTLLVGDEPRDIVFAGAAGTRAFITTAQRGQNIGFDPKLTTQGQGRADVWVFDATNLGNTLQGNPVQVLKLFGDTPRALAVGPGGTTVYAAVFDSGNQTTTVNEGAVCNGGSGAPPCVVGGVTMPGGLPAPNTNFEFITGPEVGLIVKLNPSNSHWEDRLGRNWNPAVKFNLPDKDVFAINASTLSSTFFTHVGTIIYNMAVNPVSGKVYVSNTEARNEVRFEGPGAFSGSTVRGHLHEARISILSSPSTVTPRHLNKHIDYGTVPSLPGVKDNSLATPTGIAVSSDGTTLYVAAFGSSKVGIFDTAQLEADTFAPSASDHILVGGAGPSGLVLDEARSQRYVFTRFDNSISVVDTTTRQQINHVAVYNPEPMSIVDGRPFLYDANYTSSNGEASCSSCHVFGDVDDLGWDLGDPDAMVQTFGNHFHPMKGPMTVQTLRGIATHGPLHWRGDRNAANFGGDSMDTRGAFLQFNEAFENVLGRDQPLTDTEMNAYADFVLRLLPPPNPIRSLDDSLRPNEAEGKSLFENGPGIGCSCHVLMPENGFFGTSGMITIA